MPTLHSYLQMREMALHQELVEAFDECVSPYSLIVSLCVIGLVLIIRNFGDKIIMEPRHHKKNWRRFLLVDFWEVVLITDLGFSIMLNA